MLSPQALEKSLLSSPSSPHVVLRGSVPLIGGCLPRARPQLTWSRNPFDQVDLRLALFPQASPPNAPRGDVRI